MKQLSSFTEFDTLLAPRSPVFVDTLLEPDGWLFMGHDESGELYHVVAKPSPPVLDMVMKLSKSRLIVSSIEAFTQSLLGQGVKNPPRAVYSEQIPGVERVIPFVSLGKSLTEWQVQFVGHREPSAPSDRLDLNVARILAAESHFGYPRDGVGAVHPTWNVWTPSGRITSSNPSLSNMKAPLRREFHAHPGYVWYLMGYEHPELAALASLLGSPELRQLAGKTHEAAVAEVAETLMCDPVDADRFLSLLTRRLLTPEIVAEKLGWAPAVAVTRLTRFNYAYMVRTQDQINDLLANVNASALGRPLSAPKDEGSKIGNLLTETVAVTLKLLIAEVYNWAELGHGSWIGLHGALPLYSSVAYQIDDRVDVRTHFQSAELSLRSAWQQVFQTTTPPLLLLTGPTWGGMFGLELSMEAQ